MGGPETVTTGRAVVHKFARRAVGDDSGTPFPRFVGPDTLSAEFPTPAPVITLYRSPDDPWADEIQEALDEMVIAYETETIADGATPRTTFQPCPPSATRGRLRQARPISVLTSTTFGILWRTGTDFSPTPAT